MKRPSNGRLYFFGVLIAAFLAGGLFGLLLYPYIPPFMIWGVVFIGLVVVAAIIFWQVRPR